MCKRKKIGIVIVALTVVGAGAYALAWKKHADNLERRIKAFADKSPYGKLEYASMESSGFPFRIRTVLHQPRFTLDAERLVKERAPEYYQATMVADKKQAFSDWQETASVEGDAIIEADLYSRTFSISVDGNIKHVSDIDGHSITNIFTPAAHSRAEVTFGLPNRPSLLWEEALSDVRKKYPLASSIKRAFATLDGEWKTRDKNGKELTVRACKDDQFLLEDNGADAFSVKAFYEDCDSYAEGNKAVRQHYAKLYPRKVLSNFDRVFGEGDVKDADLVLNFSGEREGEKGLAIQLKEISYKDPFISNNVTGELRHYALDGKDKYHVNLQSASKVEPEFYEDQRQKLTRFFASYAANDKDWDRVKNDVPFGAGNWLSEIRQKDPSKFGSVAAQNIFQLFPKFHEFGKIRLALDADVNLSKSNPELALNYFSFDADPYGLDVKLAKDEEKEGKSNGDKRYDLTVRHYEAMTGDAVRYADKIMKSMKRMGIGEVTYRIKPGMDAALVGLLRDFSGKDEDPLLISVLFSGADMRVGALTGMEAMQRAMMALSPFVEVTPSAQPSEKQPSPSLSSPPQNSQSGNLVTPKDEPTKK